MIEFSKTERQSNLFRVLKASVSLSVLLVAGTLLISEAAAQEQTNNSTQTNTNTSSTINNTNTASPTNTNTNTGTSTNSIDSHNVSTPQKRDPVNSATAPALTSSNDTCMGSTSAGGQAIGFGFSVGSTWTDDHCRTLKSSRLLFNMGLQDAAIARLCLDPDMATALNQSKTPCPGIAKLWKDPDKR